MVERELAEIIDICEASRGDYSQVEEDEVVKALKSLNKGKAANIFGLTTEHLACASKEMIPVLTALLNCIFHVDDLPFSLKLGLLTPIFKKKCSIQTPRTTEELPFFQFYLSCLKHPPRKD